VFKLPASVERTLSSFKRSNSRVASRVGAFPASRLRSVVKAGPDTGGSAVAIAAPSSAAPSNSSAPDEH